MKLQGRPLWKIHRFWKCFTSDELWFIEAENKEQEIIFKWYGFKELKEQEDEPNLKVNNKKWK